MTISALEIDGKNKDDVIIASSFNDTIIGGSGDDIIITNKGKDTIVFNKAENTGKDYIKDLEEKIDKLNFSNVLDIKEALDGDSEKEALQALLDTSKDNIESSNKLAVVKGNFLKYETSNGVAKLFSNNENKSLLDLKNGATVVAIVDNDDKKVEVWYVREDDGNYGIDSNDTVIHLAEININSYSDPFEFDETTDTLIF